MASTLGTVFDLYKEQADQARHHEQQRAAITSYVVVVAGAMLGLLEVDQLGASLKVPIGVFLVILGIFGALTSAKHYERHRYHTEIAKAYRGRIEELEPETAVDRSSVRKEHRTKFGVLHDLRLWWLWVVLHSLVSGLGLYIILR